MLFYTSAGFGLGLMYLGSMVRLQSYFIKHRAAANGLFASGAGSGTLLFGFMVDFMLHSYGLQNTLSILVSTFHYVPDR